MKFIQYRIIIDHILVKIIALIAVFVSCILCTESSLISLLKAGHGEECSYFDTLLNKWFLQFTQA